MKSMMTETTSVSTAPSLLATGILRARARALGMDSGLWPENTPFDLTSSASRAFMSPPDHGERRRSADAKYDALASA